jgi:hypothetical protein
LDFGLLVVHLFFPGVPATNVRFVFRTPGISVCIPVVLLRVAELRREQDQSEILISRTSVGEAEADATPPRPQKHKGGLPNARHCHIRRVLTTSLRAASMAARRAVWSEVLRGEVPQMDPYLRPFWHGQKT